MKGTTTMPRIPALLLCLLLVSSVAQAGPFTDEMSKCLVRSTNEADKTLLVKWIYAAMSAHPDVKALSNVSPQQGAQLNKETSVLVVRLLTKNCKSETEQALKYEGEKTFAASFEVLGGVAMQGIMANPDVSAYFAGFEQQLDAKALQDAFGADQQKAAGTK
jgi:hypothetical protein